MYVVLHQTGLNRAKDIAIGLASKAKPGHEIPTCFEVGRGKGGCDGAEMELGLRLRQKNEESKHN